MGFRNPIRTAVDPVAREAAADAAWLAENGIIAGSRLAADAFVGRTFTGGIFQSAPVVGSGRGWEADDAGHRWRDDTGVVVTEVRTADGRLIARGADLSGLIRTAPSGPRIEAQQSNVVGASGSVYWYSGLSDDAPAGARYEADYTDEGGGVIRTRGTRFLLTGGGSSGAARLELNSEEAAAGGYETVARLSAARLAFGGPATFANSVTFPGSLRTATTAGKGRLVYPDDYGAWLGIAPVTGWTAVVSRLTMRLGILYYTGRFASRSWAANQRIVEFTGGFPLEDMTFWSGTNEIRLRALDGVMFLPTAGSGVLAFHASWPIA